MTTGYLGRDNHLPLLLFILFLISILAMPAEASYKAQSHGSIMYAARQHIIDRSSEYPVPPDVMAGRLDKRLRLAACDQPLETFTPEGRKNTGRITVGVRCNGSQPWSLFVPVTVKVMTDVVVAKATLPRGTIIGPRDIGLDKRDISRLHRGYLESTKALVGKKLRNRIRQGQVITSSQLDNPHAIKRNNKVTIIAKGKSIQIRMAGKALENGSIGELIKVRNVNSRKELDARVIAPGIVEVPM